MYFNAIKAAMTKRPLLGSTISGTSWAYVVVFSAEIQLSCLRTVWPGHLPWLPRFHLPFPLHAFGNSPRLHTSPYPHKIPTKPLPTLTLIHSIPPLQNLHNPISSFLIISYNKNKNRQKEIDIHSLRIHIPTFLFNGQVTCVLPPLPLLVFIHTCQEAFGSEQGSSFSKG